MNTVTARTKDRILDAAERLFGERGVAGTSLRALTDAAGVNIAAVNYHFGSKEGLLRTVIRRAMTSVNEDRRRMLDQLQAAGDPTLEDLVRAFVATGASLVERHGERGRHVARFIGRVMCEPEPTVRQLFAAEVGPVEGRYLDALVTALPHLSADDVAFRYRAMVGVLALHQAGTLPDLHPSGRAKTVTANDTDRLVAMLTGLFRAPAQPTHTEPYSTT